LEEVEALAAIFEDTVSLTSEFPDFTLEVRLEGVAFIVFLPAGMSDIMFLPAGLSPIHVLISALSLETEL
jgi:hypothetical protein